MSTSLATLDPAPGSFKRFGRHGQCPLFRPWFGNMLKMSTGPSAKENTAEDVDHQIIREPCELLPRVLFTSSLFSLLAVAIVNSRLLRSKAHIATDEPGSMYKNAASHHSVPLWY